jgi:hypothetical protein
MMAQEKNRAMNARVDAYFRVPADPVAALPSPYPAPVREVDEEEGTNLQSSPSDTSSEGQESVRHSPPSSAIGKPGFLGKMKRKSKRLSVSLFK